MPIFDTALQPFGKIDIVVVNARRNFDSGQILMISGGAVAQLKQAANQRAKFYKCNY